MDMIRVVGAVDRVVNGVVVIVPDDLSPELYVSIKDLPNAREQMQVDLMIIPNEDPNGLCKVIGVKPVRPPQPMKMPAFGSMVNSMIKIRDRLRATMEELEKYGAQADESCLGELQEKIDYLEKGIRLFS